MTTQVLRTMFRPTALLRPAAILLAAFAAVPASAQVAAAPTVTNMAIRASIDEVGNGEMSLTFKMNAQQWAGWKEQYGSNPSLFKRDMQRYFSQYEVTDFKLAQDDLEREAVVTIAASAIASHLGDGVYEFKAEKEMGKGELIDGEVRYSYSQSDGPQSVMFVDQRIRLPKGAKNIELTRNGDGVEVVRYTTAPFSSGPPWTMIGLIALLLGVCMFGASMVLPADKNV